MLRSRSITILLFLAVLMSGPVGADTNANAESVQLTLAHAMPAGSKIEMLLLKPWAQRLPILSGNQVTVTIEPEASLAGGAKGLLELLSAGEADMVWLPAAEVPALAPLAELIELPFMAWPAEATSQTVTELAARRGQSPDAAGFALFYLADAPVWLHMRDTPVRRREDLQGKRLYAPSMSLRTFLASAGAEAVALDDPAQVAEMLARGALDGALLSFAVAAETGVLAVTRFHTETGRPPGHLEGHTTGRQPGLGTQVYALVMSADRFSALPAPIQDVLTGGDAAALAQSSGRAWDSLDRLEQRKAETAGHVFLSLPERELNRWRRAAAPQIEAWIARAESRGEDGAALLRAARRLAARYYVLMAEEIESCTRPTRDKGG